MLAKKWLYRRLFYIVSTDKINTLIIAPSYTVKNNNT